MKPFYTLFMLTLILGLLTGGATRAQTSSGTGSLPDMSNSPIRPADRRLKANIRNSRYGLPEVLRMRPVTYRWKHTPDASQRVGFIAQEMEHLVPEAVQAPQAPDEYYGLEYEELIPVLTRAIQEQQQQLEALKATNGRLYAKLESLSMVVRQLQANSTH